MRKLFIAALLVTASFSAGHAQQAFSFVNQPEEAPNMGVAPKSENGIGRADIRVFDQNGNPLQSVQAKLESKRSDGFFCETDWGFTNALGVLVLPPLHMGEVTLKVKAKGFQSQTIRIDNSRLGEPIRVTLTPKK
jgi:hypothetical protein